LIHFCNVIYIFIHVCILHIHKAAWADVELVSTSMKSGNILDGLKAFSRALDEVSRAIRPCDLEKEAGILATISQELGFNSIGKDLNGAMTIIVSGAEVYDDVYQAGVAMGNKQYQRAGESLGLAISEILKWHAKNGCEDPMCYILEGMSKALNILENDFASCKNDVSHMITDFQNAFESFKKHQSFEDAANGTTLLSNIYIYIYIYIYNV
jgi:hypothetical protein